jgi:FdhE protein
MIRTREELARFNDRLKDAVEKGQENAERLDLLGRVVADIFDRRESFRANVRKIGGDEARMRLAEGFPLMDPQRVFDAAVGELYPMATAFIRKYLADGGIPDREAVDRLTATLTEDEFRRRGSKMLDRQGVMELVSAEGLEVGDGNLTGFVMHSVCRPLFEAHAVEYAAMDDVFGSWDKGYCPVCGGLPAMGGLFGEEGRRKLECHRCGFDWNFGRVRCPFCDTTDHEKLRYFTMGTDGFYRVDVCDNCKGYLKSFDGRLSADGVIAWEAEDLLTTFLELAAEKEGYLPKCPNMLGLRH